MDDFFRFSKKLGFWVFLVHPTVVSVLLSALVKRCFVSCMQDFFFYYNVHFFDTVVKPVGGGSVINGADPIYFVLIWPSSSSCGGLWPGAKDCLPFKLFLKLIFKVIDLVIQFILFSSNLTSLVRCVQPLPCSDLQLIGSDSVFPYRLVVPTP